MCKCAFVPRSLSRFPGVCKESVDASHANGAKTKLSPVVVSGSCRGGRGRGTASKRAEGFGTEALLSNLLALALGRSPCVRIRATCAVAAASMTIGAGLCRDTLTAWRARRLENGFGGASWQTERTIRRHATSFGEGDARRARQSTAASCVLLLRSRLAGHPESRR